MCPNCGRAPVFSGYLRFADRCSACGADFAIADAGDGPAVFVMFVVGAVVVPIALGLQLGLRWPDWLVLAIALLLTAGLSLWLLPIFKASLFALQWRHKASEARAKDFEGEDAP